MNALRAIVANAGDYDPKYLSDAGVRVRLHRNESALPPPAHVVDAVRQLSADAFRNYPTELFAQFTAALAERLAVPAGRLAIAGGADEVLGCIARAYLEPGATMVTVKPAFGMYAHAATLAGARVCAVPYEVRWELDVEAVIRAAGGRARLVVLGHPNNPTGDPLRAQDVAAISRRLPVASVVIDEVYLGLSQLSHVPLVATLPNVIVVGSFSKSAALAGMRVGYAVARDEVAAALRRIAQPFPLGAASIAAALAFVTGGAKTRAFESALAGQNRRSLDAMEERLSPYARAFWRGPANFALFDFGDRSGELKAALENRGIAVRSYEDIPGCLRFCAASDEDTNELLEVVASVMDRASVGVGFDA